MTGTGAAAEWEQRRALARVLSPGEHWDAVCDNADQRRALAAVDALLDTGLVVLMPTCQDVSAAGRARVVVPPDGDRDLPPRRVRCEDTTWVEAAQRANADGMTISRVIRLLLRGYVRGDFEVLP